LHFANVSSTEELDAIDWYRQRADDAEDETLKAMDYLNRGRSHLPDAVWREIDKAAAEAARDRLTGRRFLELQGPSARTSPQSKPRTMITAASRRPTKPPRSGGAPFRCRCCGERFVSACGGLPGIWKMVNCEVLSLLGDVAVGD
jgi:hypothetical protein